MPMAAQLTMLQWADYPPEPPPLGIVLLLSLAIVFVVLVVVRTIDLIAKQAPAPRPIDPPPQPAFASSPPARPIPKSIGWWSSNEDRIAFQAEQLRLEIQRLETEAEVARKSTDLVMAQAELEEAIKASKPQPPSSTETLASPVPALTLREIQQLIDLADIPAAPRNRLLALVTGSIEEKNG